MITVITIGGTAYPASGRIAGSIRFDGLKRDLRGGYDELDFSVRNGSPVPTWARGTAVSATVDFGLGGGAQTKFVGEITDLSWQPGQQWTLGYTCQGLKYQVDRVPITAPDLTGDYVLNRRPDDREGVDADRGLTVGQIFTRVLTIQDTANALAALGVQYASLGPPTLHATTVADFALLTIVPPQPVSLGGESILNTLDQILSRWMPKYVLEITPAGLIRCKDTTDLAVFVPRTLTLPGTTGPGNPGVQWPSIRSSTARCATRLILRGGPIIAATLLSTADGTLARTWNNTDESNWTLYEFTAPKGAKDTGTIVSMTGNTATLHSSDATRTWAANFWSGRLAQVYLIDTTVSGISGFEYRHVTANAALSAGGNASVTWDASQPASGSSYNKYRLVGGAGSLNDVSRLYTVREPHTGAVGTATYIGAHLVVANLSPKPIKWANNSKSIDVFAPTAVVVGGTVATEVPMGVEALPATGQFRLFQPAVMAHGNPSDLNAGYPADVAHGLPTDVQVLALYSRGALSVTVPASGWEGTAYSVDGLQVVRYMDVPAYADEWDAASMTLLAQQHLDAIKDIVWEGSGELLTDPGWDVLEFNYALNYAVDGGTSPWTAINAPVRAVSIRPGEGSGAKYHVTFEFSTQRRPFSGDDLYLHPAFTHAAGWQGNSDIGDFAGMPVTGGFQMPIGQDQGNFDFSGGLGRGKFEDKSPEARIERAHAENRSEERDRKARQDARRADDVADRARDHADSPEARVERAHVENRAEREATKLRMADHNDRKPAERAIAAREAQGLAAQGGIISPEAPHEKRDRIARQPWDPLPSREEALAQDDARRSAIDLQPGANPQPREPLPSREQAQAEDRKRRESINQAWADRHPDDPQNAGGGG